MVAEARSWKHTPWRHQGRVKGIGVDCIGLALAAADASGLLTPEMRAELPFNYSRTPGDGSFLRIVRKHMVLIEGGLAACKIGDMPLMCWGTFPMHIGVLSDYNEHGGVDAPFGLIHAIIQQDKVNEQLFDAKTLTIRGYYRLKGLD